MNKRILYILLFIMIPMLAWSQGKVVIPKPATKPSTNNTNQPEPTEKAQNDVLEYQILNEASRTVEVSRAPDDISGSLTIPSQTVINGKTYSVTSIGLAAFEYCEGLTNIIIPSSVTTIGESAFSSCKSLTSISIPKSVTSIGEQAFYGCNKLININISPDNKIFASISGIIYSKNLTKLIYCPEGISGNLKIPSSVTSIGEHAFLGCSSLTSITIPGSVKSIGNDAFLGCSSLTSVTIPNSVTSIGDYAFNGCSSLTSVTIPNSVIFIGMDAFSYCENLKEVTIPARFKDSIAVIFQRVGNLKTINYTD